MEEWRDIKGYEGLYQVSNEGRVKSFKFGKEKILKNCKDSGGYFQITLYKDGKRKKYKVHRIVASAFLDNPNNLLEINHKDEDKTNNNTSNLEWCSREYNNNYGSRNEKMAKTNSKPILQFTKNSEFVRRWNSIKEAERELGKNSGDICSCLKGRCKTAGGFIWGYEKDYKRIPFKVFDLEIYEKVS